MSEEQVIEMVKQYPVLYDRSLLQYRDNKIRNNAWEEIAERMNTTVEDVKEKWGKLRNCYTNALKRRRKKSLNPWKFEPHMEFLLTQLESRKKVTELPSHEINIKDNDSTEDSVLQFSDLKSEESRSPIFVRTQSVSPDIRATPSRSINPEDNPLLKVMDNLNYDRNSTSEIGQKRTSTGIDENDYFFLSMSKQLKKLPETDQSVIRFQLHKLVHDAEMKMLKHCKN